MRNKYSIAALLLSLVLIISGCSMFDGIKINISEVKYIEYGERIHYTDWLFEKVRDKDELNECFGIIDRYFTENYDFDVDISNLNYFDLDNEIFFYGHAMSDNVDFEDTYFRLTLDRESKEIKGFDDYQSLEVDTNISKEGIIDHEKAVRTAYDLIEKNTDKILSDDEKTINSVWYLICNEERELMYYFGIEYTSSFIRIDAFSGKVIGYYFDNGVIIG